MIELLWQLVARTHSYRMLSIRTQFIRSKHSSQKCTCCELTQVAPTALSVCRLCSRYAQDTGAVAIVAADGTTTIRERIERTDRTKRIEKTERIKRTERKRSLEQHTQCNVGGQYQTIVCDWTGELVPRERERAWNRSHWAAWGRRNYYCFDFLSGEN